MCEQLSQSRMKVELPAAVQKVSIFLCACRHLAKANLDALWHAVVSVMRDESPADRVRRLCSR